MTGIRKIINTSLTTMAILLLGQVFGQEPNQHMVKLANHDGAERNTVVNGYYNYSRYQYIYTKEEIGQSGTINALSFYVYSYYTSVNTGTINNVSIKIGTTTASSFATASYDNTLQQVWSGNISFSGLTGWVKITLDTPLNYDQTENLIIEIRSEDGSWSNNPFPQFTYTLTKNAQNNPTNTAVKGYSDNNNPPVPYLSDRRGDIIFEFEQPDSSQTSVVSIGNNEEHSQSALINGYYKYSKVQYLYDDLQIGKTGEITSLSFNLNNYYAGVDRGKIDQITILMGHSNTEEFTGAAQYVSGLQEVWSGVFNSKGNGWYTFDLETGFVYNGTQNLIIEIRSQDGSWNNNPYPEFFYTLNYHPDMTVEYRGIKGYSDSKNPPDPFLSNSTADVKIGFKALGLTSSIINSNCNIAGGSGAIDLTVTSGTVPYTYSWVGPNSFTSTSEDLTGLEIGVYTVIVTDAQNKTATASYEIGNEITWIDLIGVSLDTNNNPNKTALNGWSNAGAASSNKLLAGEDGYVSMKIENLTDQWTIGLSSQNNGESWATINYAFDKTNNDISIYEEGYFIGSYGFYTIGDIIKIAREGDYIKYYLNNIQLSSTFTGSSEQLIIDATIYNQGGTLKNVISSFCIPIEIFATTTNVNCINQNSGTINLTVTGGVSPYTYSWSNGATTQNISNLIAGTYVVTVTDALSNTLQQSVNINHDGKIIWEGFVLTEIDGNGDLVKTGINGWSNSDAVSTNKIRANQDGYVSMIVDNLTDEWTIGLSAQNDGLGWETIDYALDKTLNYVTVFENGYYIGGYGSFNIGDEIKVAREGSSIKYYKNNILLTSTITDPSLELMVDITIYNQGGKLKNILTDFCGMQLQASYTTTDVSQYGLGSINFLLDYVDVNSVLGFSIYDDLDSLIGVSDTTFISGFNIGDYTIVIKDTVTTDSLAVVTFSIGENIVWKTQNGATIVDGTVTKTGATGWSDGVLQSLNTLDITGDGSISFEIIDVSTTAAMGFNDANVVDENGLTALKYGFVTENGLVDIYEDGMLVADDISTFTMGDVLEVEKIGSQLFYRQNGSNLRVGTFSGTQVLGVHIGILQSSGSIKKGPFQPKHQPGFFPSLSFDVTNISCGGVETIGTIQLTSTGGAAYTNWNYSFIDENGVVVQNSSLPTLNNAPIGCYNVIVTADLGNFISYFNQTLYTCVGYKLNYSNLIGTQVIGERVQKISGPDPGTFFSTNNLEPNMSGWLCFNAKNVNVGSLSNIYGIGLSSTDNGTIEYGFYFYEPPKFTPHSPSYKRYGLIFQGVNSGLSFYNVEDRFKVEREVINSTTAEFHYYVNDQLIYTLVSNNPSQELFGNGVFYLGNGLFEDVVVNFCNPCDFTVLPSEHIELCPDESIQVNAMGLDSYLWSPATGLSCTTCPNPTIDANTAVGEYTVFGYEINGTGTNPNLVVNGTFDTDLSGWVLTSFGDWQWIAGQAEFNGTDEGDWLEQNILTVGNTYQVDLDVSKSESYVFTKIYLGTTEIDVSSDLIIGTVHISFTAQTIGSGIFKILMYASGSNIPASIDNILVRKLEPRVCGTKTVTVVVKEDCDQDILGCCFSNYGAGVYVSSSTNLNVYCNLLNELGANSTGGSIEKGEFVNYGDINVKLDWINNGQNILFLNNSSVLASNYGSGIADFFGDNQNIRGNSSTNFYNLELGESDYQDVYGNPGVFLPSSAGGVKTMKINQYVYNKMDLQNSELAAGDHVMFVENDNPNLLYRGSGQLSISGGNGFVSTDGIGYLSRSVNSSSDYFFPMGSYLGGTRYRPIAIMNSSVDKFKVNFQNHNPFNDGLTILSPSVLSVNDKYYHKINNITGSSASSRIRAYYTPGDGSFQSVSHWGNSNPWWESTLGQANSTVQGTGLFDNGLYYAETVGPQSFNDEPYVIATSGFVIGTPNWPTGTGTNGPNPSTPESSGCTANFDYTISSTGELEISFVSLSSITFLDELTTNVPNASLTWDFGDYTPSVITGVSSPSPTSFTPHQYAPGNYTIHLTVSDNNGTHCYTTAQITVNGTTITGPSGPTNSGCTANFSFYYNGGGQVQFVNNTVVSSGAIFTWHFGDLASGANNESNLQHPAPHNYTSNGTYTVYLDVLDNGNTCSTYGTIEISDFGSTTPGGNPIPGGSQSCSISFTSLINGFDYNITSVTSNLSSPIYTWNLGDGTVIDPTTVPTSIHTYANPGINSVSYPVTLTVHNGTTSCFATENVTISQTGVSLPGESEPCSVSFTSSINGFDYEITTATSNLTSPTYTWELGDGSVVQYPTGFPTNPYTYTPGATSVIYQVKLTVSNGITSCFITENVTVSPTEISSSGGSLPCSLSFTSLVNGLDYEITGAITNLTSATYKWDLGAGAGLSSTLIPTSQYSYSLPGTYPVVLTVSDGTTSCSATENVTFVEIGPVIGESEPCSVSFTSSINGFDYEITTATSNLTSPTYTWELGDGSVVQYPTGFPTNSYTYTPGATSVIYPVKLTVSNGTTSCFITENVTVSPTEISSPGGSLPCSLSFTSLINGFDFQITGAITNLTSATYKWDLGVGAGLSSTLIPTSQYSYASPGTYPVVLTVNDGTTSCSATENVTIFPIVGGPFIGGGSSGCSSSFTSIKTNSSVYLSANVPLVPPIPTYTWDFGDGNSATGTTAYHTFANNGSYTVTLYESLNGVTCPASEIIQITSVSSIVYEVTGPCTSNALSGTGSGSGSNGSGNNTILLNMLPCELVMDITGNDNCVVDGKIYFKINEDFSLGYIKYRPDGATIPGGDVSLLPDLSPEVYTTTVGVPGFTLLATPKELLQSCINSTSVSMGPNNDFVLLPTEIIVINSPFAINTFTYGTVGGTQSSPVSFTTGSGGISTITGLPPLTAGVYEFNLGLTVGATIETIKGQFIAN